MLLCMCYCATPKTKGNFFICFNLRQGNFHLPTFWFIDKTSCIVRILISVSANAFVHLKFLVKVSRGPSLIGGGTGGVTRGMCPPLVRICLLVPPPPLKLSGTVTFLTIPRRWNTCSDGSVIPEHGERRSKNTPARSKQSQDT